MLFVFICEMQSTVVEEAEDSPQCDVIETDGNQYERQRFEIPDTVERENKLDCTSEASDDRWGVSTEESVLPGLLRDIA